MNVATRAFDVGAIADAHDIQFLRKAAGNALDGISRERAREPVQRGEIVAVANEFQTAVAPRPTRMPAGIGTVSLPFGPSTCSWSPIDTFTPLGSGIGFFPTLDMIRTPLTDLAEDFSAHALLARVAARHDAAGRCQNVDTQSAEHVAEFPCSWRIPGSQAAKYATSSEMTGLVLG